MQSLTSNLRGFFSSAVRTRGSEYFFGEKVDIKAADHESLEAVVQGTIDYYVAMNLYEGQLMVDCTCPYFADRAEPCKHIYACLLAAEAEDFLGGPGGHHLPTMISTGEEENSEDDELHDLLDEFGKAREGSSYQKALASLFRKLGIDPGDPPSRAKPFRRGQSWKDQLPLGEASDWEPASSSWPRNRQVIYRIDVPATFENSGKFVLEVLFRQLKKNGEWGLPKKQTIEDSHIATMNDESDRRILSFLAGARNVSAPYYTNMFPSGVSSRNFLSESMQKALVPMMCETGRCWMQLEPHEVSILSWDPGPPWEFCLKVELDAKKRAYQLNGYLHRGEETRELSEPELLMSSGLVFWKEEAAELNHRGAFPWIAALRQHGTIWIPRKERDAFLERLLSSPAPPEVELPEEMAYEEVRITPRPVLKIASHEGQFSRSNILLADLYFRYGEEEIPVKQAGAGIFDGPNRRFLPRDVDFEEQALDRLYQLGCRDAREYMRREEFQINAKHLPGIVRELVAENWHIEADGQIYRKPGQFNISVTSGIDWFELHADVQFGETKASLPELLKALEKGEETVTLDDGSLGMLPEDWLKKYGLLAGLGKPEENHLRFSKSQVGFLDALLAAQPEVNCDEVFMKVQQELRGFEGIRPLDAPSGFRGSLRDYQKDGIGWFDFLRRFGFGGCLADDMGLGKTIQVLSLLESRRQTRAASRKAEAEPAPRFPSLAVVPKSIVYNWIQEAARFTPELRVVNHTGTGRAKSVAELQEADLVITTYGTLRRDIAFLKDARFDYCILDESQAIKNAKTASAKAARLVQAEQRLALSGTPIENNLGELWSLFEFLNPGMLGSASLFNLLAGSTNGSDSDGRQLLARSLRPFILRRTKDQVATELPPKLEQTVYCELEPRQRKLYNELRDHYRKSLLGKIDKVGLGRSKIQVLEALLRLRQAAIHPGLIDEARKGHTSAKLELLLPQLEEVCEEGHKVLVFSQFTKMLSILKNRLDKVKIPYLYLDGKTRKRGEMVEQFQTDPDIQLFLISLKAGGLGLNLTAAEYVFLLDPWWNPAVESQAIDRAHRIGQSRKVFAYRLIARDTVEEKVLELQDSKRKLADAIINADNSLIRDLKREDLELLLS